MPPSSAASFSTLWRAYAEGRLERSLELIDPECLVVMVDGRTYRGHDGLREWLAEVRRRWKTLTVTYERVEEPHPGWIVGIGRAVGASADGQHRLDRRLACVGEFRDGRLVHGRSFEDADEALGYARERVAPGPAAD
jgi:ketosteroid isomerase-like protein